MHFYRGTGLYGKVSHDLQKVILAGIGDPGVLAAKKGYYWLT